MVVVVVMVVPLQASRQSPVFANHVDFQLLKGCLQILFHWNLLWRLLLLIFIHLPNMPQFEGRCFRVLRPFYVFSERA